MPKCGCESVCSLTRHGPAWTDLELNKEPWLVSLSSGCGGWLSAAGLAGGLGRMRVIYGRDFQNCLQVVEGEKLRLLGSWKLKYRGGLGPKRCVWFGHLGLGDDGASGLWGAVLTTRAEK